jgi:tRNA(fMet)-specific endonuclease VapC
MAYLIDSDWVIDYLAGVPDALELLDRLAEEGIAISIVTYMEVYQGVERSDNPEEAERRLASFLEAVPLLPVSPAVARRGARLRETLRSQGKRVANRALDLLIAATAIEYGLTLVTRNVRDYSDIPDLKTSRA